MQNDNNIQGQTSLGDKKDEGAPSSLLAMGVILALVVIAAYLGWNFLNDDSRANDSIVTEVTGGYQELVAFSEGRDAQGAVEKADELLMMAQQADAPPNVEAEIRSVRATNLFRMSEVEGQKEAVRTAKEIAVDTRLSRARRASAANALLSFYYSARSRFIFDEIFTGDPFASLAEGEEKDAVRRLAEFSMDLYPTSFAALRVAVWYSGELLDNKSLTEDTRSEYKNSILELIKQADELIALELSQAETNQGYTFDPTSMLTRFHYWKGFNLAAATVGIPSESQDFERSFQEALSMYKPNEVESDNIATTIVYTNFYYAAYLHEIYKEERSGDQKILLENLVNIITSNPQLHQSGFIAFMAVERDRTPSMSDHNRRWFVELAEVSPEFYDFLTEYGWELPENE